MLAWPYLLCDIVDLTTDPNRERMNSLSSQVSEPTELHFGPFRLDIGRHLLFKADEPVSLNSRALELLTTLATHPGQVITKNQLVACGWPNAVVEESNLRVQMAA